MHYNMLTASSNPQFALQVNNCNQIIIGSAALFPLFQYQFLEIFQFPLSAAFSHQFHSKFHPVFYSLIPPLAFPLTTVPCRVPPPLDGLSLPCQYGHFPTCALNEHQTSRCSMLGPLILSRETPLSTYKVTCVWPKACHGLLKTHTHKLHVYFDHIQHKDYDSTTIVFLSCVSTPTRYQTTFTAHNLDFWR